MATSQNFVDLALEEFDREVNNATLHKPRDIDRWVIAKTDIPAIKQFLKTKLEEAYNQGIKDSFDSSKQLWGNHSKASPKYVIKDCSGDCVVTFGAYKSPKVTHADNCVYYSASSDMPELRRVTRKEGEDSLRSLIPEIEKMKQNIGHRVMNNTLNANKVYGYNEALEEVSNLIKAITERTSSPEEKL